MANIEQADPLDGAAGSAPARRLVTLVFRKDESIFLQGEAAGATYGVVSGAVRTCRYLADGRRQVLGFHLPGDLFGLQFGATHRCSAESIGLSRLRVLPRAETLEAVLGPAAACAAIQLAMARAEDLGVALGKMLSHEKVAHFLLDLAGRYRSDRFRLVMVRQDLADHLGLTLETISRTTSLLERAGLIAFDAQRTEVHLLRRDALQRVAGGDPLPQPGLARSRRVNPAEGMH